MAMNMETDLLSKLCGTMKHWHQNGGEVGLFLHWHMKNFDCLIQETNSSKQWPHFLTLAHFSTESIERI